MIKNCPLCKKSFNAIHSHNIFCSRSCAVKGRRGNTRENKREFICKQCGNFYYRKASQKGKTLFCSKKCRSIFQKENTNGKNNPNYKDGRSFCKQTNSGKGRNYKKGRYYENKTRKVYERRGYFVVRSAASKGCADLIAINNYEVILIQVKAGKSFFSPLERKTFGGLKVPQNCRKELWAWLNNKPPRVEEVTLKDLKSSKSTS